MSVSASSLIPSRTRESATPVVAADPVAADLVTALAEVADPRARRGVRHRYASILALRTCAGPGRRQDVPRDRGVGRRPDLDRAASSRAGSPGAVRVHDPPCAADNGSRGIGPGHLGLGDQPPEAS